MVAKRFSSTTDKKRGGGGGERKKKKTDADSERKTRGAKKVGEASSKAKGPQEHVCFPKDRSLRAASTK